MKLARWLGVVVVSMILGNVLGCAPHDHHVDVISETVVEQTEVVE